MGLTSHALAFCADTASNDVEYRAISREQHIQGLLQLGLVELLRNVLNEKTVIVFSGGTRRKAGYMYSRLVWSACILGLSRLF